MAGGVLSGDMSSSPPFPSARREAALAALEDFIPRAGWNYAEQRNHDNGPSDRTNVSMLSPWIRLRQLTEWETVAAVRREHDANSAGKFIDEVCWRTYWKGWLQLRPSIWTDYRRRVARLQMDEGMSGGVQAAMTGKTGIDCFDAWAQELVEMGYLHNHARMWTASIWIHTLKLPWELGADWFLRHLLDGDPASNTLSWRWVAGLHTAGKTYLATRANIRRHTNDRFEVNAELATAPLAMPDFGLPPIQPLKPGADWDDGEKVAVLLTDDDLSAEYWISSRTNVSTVAGFFPTAAYTGAGIADSVVAFRRAAMMDRTEAVWDDLGALRAWVESLPLKRLIMAEPPVGLTAELMPAIRQVCGDAEVDLRVVRHDWDHHFWPHATHGFFRFKKAIPAALRQLVGNQG